MPRRKSANPRPQTEADLRYNERRRARRALEKMREKTSLQRGSALEQTQRNIQALSAQIENSLYDRKTKSYKQSLEQLRTVSSAAREEVARLSEMTRERSLSENIRINDMVMDYFRSASYTSSQKEAGTAKSIEQQYARDVSEHFYSTTAPLWRGGDKGMINENILAALENVTLSSGRRVQNLQDAMEWVRETYGEASWPRRRSVENGEVDTSDGGFGSVQEEQGGSPPYITVTELRRMGVNI